MSVFIAVLRAVNVSGTAKVPMAELKTACEAAGLRDVATYIASGNLVFEHDGTAGQVQAIVAGVLRETFGLTKNHTIVRTPDALARALADNPFADAAADRPASLMLQFLEAVPPDGGAQALARWTGPERVHLAGDHLYVDYVEGAGRSKLLPAVIERMLKVAGTARNWNTSRKLLEMAQRQ
jgi:uncharacterized protein (DUF1697 family)